jgi:hypothetical protein
MVFFFHIGEEKTNLLINDNSHFTHSLVIFSEKKMILHTFGFANDFLYTYVNKNIYITHLQAHKWFFL